jgi:hypothetical protein
MQIFKILLSIFSAVLLVVAGWLYFTKNEACADQPWWLVLVLGVLNLALVLYLVLAKKS